MAVWLPIILLHQPQLAEPFCGEVHFYAECVDFLLCAFRLKPLTPDQQHDVLNLQRIAAD